MRTTTGPLAAARRWTTGALVAAGLATGVVGVHLAVPAASAVAVGTAAAAGSAGASSLAPAARTSDGSSSARPPSRSGFGAVAPVQPGNGRAQSKTSGS